MSEGNDTGSGAAPAGSRLAARPEARYALVCGVFGGIVAAVITVKGIFASASSTAAIGFLFVPFIALAVAIPSGIWGLALGYLVRSLRGEERAPRLAIGLAFLLVVLAPIALGRELWNGYRLQEAVREVPRMSAAELERAFVDSPWRANKFYLGMLAQQPAATPGLLDRMVSLGDPELSEPMGSALWDLMGKNRKGLAVMRLVVAHPNASPSTLRRVADTTKDEYVIGDLLRNPATPPEVLARYYGRADDLVEWGLAANPKLPPEQYERLSKSSNTYTRSGLVSNPGTPLAVLERLAADPEHFIARNAAHTLERRRPSGK